MNDKNLDDKFKKALIFYHAGQLKQAEGIYREILVSEPSNDKAFYGLGLVAFQSGFLTQASQLIEKAVSISPSNSEYQAALGNALYSIANYPKSVIHYKKALKKDPKNSTILNNLGHAYQANLDIENAILCYKNATSNDKNNLEYRGNLALCLQKSGAFKLAEKEYKRILKNNPNSVEIEHNLGALYLENNHLEHAIRCFEKCIELNPGYALAYNSLGAVETKNQKIGKAIKYYEKALEIDPTYFEANINLANLYELSNHQEKTNKYYEISTIINLYNKALSINPNHEKTLYSIGCAYESAGDIEKSKIYFEKLLSINPNDIHAIFNYTRLMNKKDYSDKYIKNIEEVANKNKKSAERHILNFSLAHIYDKKGEYILAEKNFIKANKLRSKKNNYNKNKIKLITDETIKSFTYELYDEFKDNNLESIRPIFILGMPRSGTSLIEQIISNHSKVYGAGEISKMAQIEEKYTNLHSQKMKYPLSIKFINNEIMQGFATEYIKYLVSLNSDLKVFTDKLPGNFIRIGLIKLLFPNAKIIHCRRHPLDTCLSIFFTNFDNIDYSFNINNIANYYLCYSRLMAHWKKLFSNEIYEIHYEDFVRQSEKNIRDIFSYCELDWNDSLLNHLHNKRPVHTASVMQVRKPIYKTSIERFRNYTQLTNELLTIPDFESLVSAYDA